MYLDTVNQIKIVSFKIKRQAQNVFPSDIQRIIITQSLYFFVFFFFGDHLTCGRRSWSFGLTLDTPMTRLCVHFLFVYEPTVVTHFLWLEANSIPLRR